ncbi:hypothetical protein A4G19_15855 [Pasteurellaceae bacterium Macca]|nr:hypothetical protein [Pasteurellaceae bacterium Macca]MCK3656150.1 hypothetical protein [Pasteurellaceae bacterium Macca]MCK3656257.1 hypothetical protein [Pasteurellaceae bacterium Macca]MCK3656508.1 hypothetical protein [Pasteurellaceae bacterium Macca]MCK3657130.1 hypothetical protein [Pasteurellaceae bacterium Macca]
MAYSDLLIWQYQNKPKALATIQLLEVAFAGPFQLLSTLPDVLNIETATGKNLDVIGRHIGQFRVLNGYALRKFFGFKDSPLALSFSRQRQGGGEWYRRRDPLADSVRLSDEDYRFLIKCRILKNYQTGTLPNIIEAARFLFGENSNAEDNYDMTVSIYISANTLNAFKRYAIEHLDILPRQAGVNFHYVIG